MSQSRKASLVEILTTTSVKFLASTAISFFVLPFYGAKVSLGQSVSLTVIFTISSITISYVMRRTFNNMEVKGVLK